MYRIRAIAIALVVTFVIAGFFVIGYKGDSEKPVAASATFSPPLHLDQPLIRTASSTDTARLLTQASFGATHASLVAASAHESLSSWIDEQIALPATLQLPAVQAYGNGSLRPPRHYVWWETAINAEDQLRQRVAFALSEIFVVSDIDYTLGNAQHGVVHFYDMLATSAFGNFRELLESITLHPVMGIYLSMVRNEKADPVKNIRPDENYAREVMQLFTIGLYELNEGGVPIPVGNPAPAYTQSTVEEYARVFTGWNFADSPEWQSIDLTPYDKITPMVPQDQFHDTGSKQLLGGVVAPAGQSAREDLELALDSLFNHPNVGPFIGRLLIQRLVTSNPSEQYVARVAAAFNNNGKNVRGDLEAVIKAILLDEDARQPVDSMDANSVQNYGKLKEPLIKVTQILRALNASPSTSAQSNFHLYSKTSDGADEVLGQAVQKSPSVFNFFSPSFRSSRNLAGTDSKTLYAPELQILTESLLSTANNDLHSMLYSANNRSDASGRSAVLNIDAPIFMLRKGRDAYLEHMNVLLFSGSMSANMQSILKEFIDERVGVEPEKTDINVVDKQLAELDEALMEAIVLDSLFMMLASPEFMVQR